MGLSASGYVAVDHDDGDAGLLSFLKDGAVAGLDEGGEEDGVDLASDEGADRLDLVLLLLLRVGVDQRKLGSSRKAF